MRSRASQCKTPKASDESFSLQVNKEHKKHAFFLIPRAAGLKKFKEEEAFVVRHFAGNVCYMSKGFMDKNNDTLSPDFEQALGASSNSLLAGLFAVEPAAGGKKKGTAFNSVGRRFINDLDSLMTDLGATHAHFIRCLKPNPKLVRHRQPSRKSLARPAPSHIANRAPCLARTALTCSLPRCVVAGPPAGRT